MSVVSNKLRTWLTEELDRLGWSYGELSRRAEVSRPLISRTLSGDMPPSADFCIKIAQALGEPPEKVLRLADILPQLPGAEDELTIEEINDALRGMTPEQRKEALHYIRYLYQKGRHDD
jgi:transcriptional regulator with XRE-family HTH domain